MFFAAMNIQAARFTRIGLLFVCVGYMADPASAQNQDVLGPPAVARTVVEPLGTQPDPPAAQKNDAQSEAVREEISLPQRSFSKSDLRLLGAASQPTPQIDSDPGEVQKDTSPIGNMGKTAWATAVVLALIMIVATGVRIIAKRQGGLRAALGPGGRAPSGLLEVLGRFPIGRGHGRLGRRLVPG